MFGFINLDKPKGWTSHDCVARVRRLLKIKRVGHGGTLDPAATGVLPIAVGKATRLLQYLPNEKAYQARIRLGVQTTTDDLEGKVIQTKSAPELTLENVEPLLRLFVGQISQIPPAYSAIQKDGKRLYELARAGEVVDVPSRRVHIYGIEVLGWSAGEFPEIDVKIACGGGTYIRAIARDLGAMLNTGGTLAGLIRTLSCALPLEESLTLEDIEAQLQQETFSLIPPDRLLSHIPTVTLATEIAKRWCQGQKLVIGRLDLLQADTTIVRVYEADGHFLGIGELVEVNSETILKPKTVIGC